MYNNVEIYMCFSTFGIELVNFGCTYRVRHKPEFCLGNFSRVHELSPSISKFCLGDHVFPLEFTEGFDPNATPCTYVLCSTCT